MVRFGLGLVRVWVRVGGVRIRVRVSLGSRVICSLYYLSGCYSAC